MRFKLAWTITDVTTLYFLAKLADFECEIQAQRLIHVRLNGRSSESQSFPSQSFTKQGRSKDFPWTRARCEIS